MKKIFIILSLLCLSACSPAGSADYHFDITGGYYVYRTSNHQIGVFSKSNAIGIPPKIVELGWNAHFIVAKQQELSGASYKEPVAGAYQYWIIEVDQSKVLGPLSESEYLTKRREINIPESVILEPIEAHASTH